MDNEHLKTRSDSSPDQISTTARSEEQEPEIIVQKMPKKPVSPQELDNTNINSLKTMPMGVEGQPVSEQELQTTTKTVEQQRKELAQRFVFEDASKIPPGVDPLQLDFLHEAANVGAFSQLRNEQTANIIAQYFTTQATYSDIAKQHRISVPAVRERITRGITQLRRVLYAEKSEYAKDDKYPLKQINKGKKRLEVLRSDQSKIRSSKAQGSK